MRATLEELSTLEKIGPSSTIQEYYRAYKYSKLRSSANKALYPRPYLANSITLYLIRKLLWGELDQKTQFHWEVFNTSRISPKGIMFGSELANFGVPDFFLNREHPDYVVNQIRSRDDLNEILDKFKEFKLAKYQTGISRLDEENLKTTNFSLRIPDPESKFMIGGKYVGTSYFDIPLYVINTHHLIGLIRRSEPILMDHKYTDNPEGKSPPPIDNNVVYPLKHIVDLKLLQPVVNFGNPSLLVNEPWF